MFPHPAARILLWCMAAGALQRFAPAAVLITGLLLAPMLHRHGATDRFLRLLRRVRWLLAALLLVFALSAAWGSEGLGAGLVEGLTQVARLVVTLALLALLLATTTWPETLGGLSYLLRALRLAGLDAERAAVRMALTLHYCESVRPGPDWRHWGAELQAAAPAVRPDVKRSAPMAPADLAAVAVGAAILAGALAL